jgi:hypothetical protein
MDDASYYCNGNRTSKKGVSMKKRVMLAVVSLGILYGNLSVAAEEPVSTSRLKIYSGGFSLGGSVAISDSLKDFTRGMGNLSFVNTFFFRDNVSFFWDVNWFFPRPNFGSDLGVDFNLLTGDVKPYIGFGAGVQYFDVCKEFSDNIGPDAVVHAGISFELTNAVDAKVFVPYHIVLNRNRDQTIGVQFALMFSNRFKKVRALEYNN